MPTTIASIEEVKAALEKFIAVIVEEGGYVDSDNVNYELLTHNVNAEYKCGCDGSVYDVIIDLNNTVGLDSYGLYID